MKIHWDVIQGTDEWHELRKGRFTASKGTAIGNCGAGLITLVDEMIIKMMGIVEEEKWLGSDIERGNRLEPLARTKYIFQEDIQSIEVGFVDLNERVGFSPDGLTFEDEDITKRIIGGQEFKARNNKKHYDLLLGGKLESAVIWQMQFAMLVTGAEWWDFGSYNPNFNKSLYVQRVYPDLAKHAKLNQGFAMGIQLLEKKLKHPEIQTEING